MAELERALFGTSEEPKSLGRYVPLERLGQGGHGVVYAAQDPELRRKVAIKLLRSTEPGDELGEERLMREAHALSKVIHPNVVPIYDIGRVDRGVYLVMKLVEGQRLDVWWEAKPRGWAAIATAFTQAARGLEAAHSKGIVHRDFKPGNVVIQETAKDLHVTVLDFGLAAGPRVPSDPTEDGMTEQHARRGAGETTFDERLTSTGIALGTPLYMSPEQHRGGAVDARSDQYSLCASLYQALFGALPWAGCTFAEATDLKSRPSTIGTPRARGVPNALGRLVARGLAVDPGARFESMSALIAELEAIPRRRLRRRIGAAAVVAVLVPLGAMLGTRAVAARECEAQADRSRAAFTQDDRQTIAQRYDGVTPYAADTTTWVNGQLSEYRDKLATQLVTSCEATEVRSEQPESDRLHRDACLRHRVDALEATVTAILEAPATANAVNRLGDAVGKLPAVAVCEDPPDRAGVVAPWEAAHVEVEQQRLAAEVAGTLGEQEDAVHRLEALRDDAQAAGDQALEGRLLLSLGDAYRWALRFEDARSAYAAGLLAAESAGDDETVTRMLSSMAVSYQDKDTQRFEELLDRAAARVESKPVDDSFAGHLALRYAHLYALTGRYEKALAAANDGAERFSRAFGGGHPTVANAILWRAKCLYGLERNEAADTAFAEAEALFTSAFGPSHPKIAHVLESWGGLLMEMDRVEDGRRAYHRLWEMAEARDGADGPATLWAKAHLGQATMRAGDMAEGRQILDDALAGLDASPVAGSVGHAELLKGIAIGLARVEDYAGAEEVIGRSISMLEKTVTPDHPTLLRAREARAEIAKRSRTRP